jgi:phosphatidylethanolamine/phosphatidyl-N-methylethanolamine N-methyltransferase
MNAYQKLQTNKTSQSAISHSIRFLRSWFQNPLIAGAVAPSGKALARTMAGFVDIQSKGPVIELGPGTGPVTEALLKHGVAEERLVLLEYSQDFCENLRQRFPKATIIQGDAYALKNTVGLLLKEPAAAVVSSLPLLTKPQDQRLALLNEAFNLMQPNAPFIQFTYSSVSSIPLDNADHKVKFNAKSSSRIWLNIPPARVWVYTQNGDSK